MLGKKGVSPLIATVLLVGFVIVIGGLILSWSVSFIDGGVKKSESDIVLFCASNIGFEVSNVCNGRFDVENLKSRRIDGFIVTLVGEGFEEVDGLGGYESGSFDVANAEEIIVSPSLIVNGNQIVCSGVKKKVNDCGG